MLELVRVEGRSRHDRTGTPRAPRSAVPRVLHAPPPLVDLPAKRLLHPEQRIRPRLTLRPDDHGAVLVELGRHDLQAARSLREQLLFDLELIPLGDAGQVHGHEPESIAQKKRQTEMPEAGERMCRATRPLCNRRRSAIAKPPPGYQF
jgi:hypothetical protein